MFYSALRADSARFATANRHPLARMKQGDWILYYSPKTDMNSGEKVQAFTAVGQIVDDRVYQSA